MGRRRTRAMAREEFEDPRVAPLSRIRLSAPQEKLLREAALVGEFGLEFDERRMPAADTLADWGFVTGGNRRRTHASFVKVTTRGYRWLARYGRRA